MNKKQIIFWVTLALLVVALVVSFFTCREALYLFSAVVIGDIVGTWIYNKLIGKNGTESEESSVEE